jgi:nicotinamidase-related amidase
VLRIPWYVDLIAKGDMNPRPTIRVEKETAATVLIDGDRALGPVVTTMAMRRAIDKARAAGLRIGFVRVGFSPDYRECPPNSPIFSGARKNGVFKLGEWGTQVHPDLAQQPGDFDIVKHRVSPFYATTLEAILRAHGIRRIYCSGISTNAVVQAMVREGHDRDYEMVVLEDCCCALSAEEHQMAIATLKRFCRLTSSEEVQLE